MKQMSQRQHKVAEELRHHAATALLGGRLTSTIDLTRVTVLDVWVSPDLRLCRLYVEVPQGWDIDATLDTLNHEITAPLRKYLAAHLATKFIPAPTFMSAVSEDDRF
jgi:ribosome-binding factor A